MFNFFSEVFDRADRLSKDRKHEESSRHWEAMELLRESNRLRKKELELLSKETDSGSER